MSLPWLLAVTRVLEGAAAGPLTAAGVAELTGMDASESAALTRALALGGLVTGEGPVRADPAAASLLGFDIGGTRVRAGLADGTGRLVDIAEEGSESVHGQALAEQLVRLAKRLLPQRPGPLRAAVAGCPGVADPDSDEIALSPNAPAVEGATLRRHLEEALEVPVDVDNDVSLSAAAEGWLGVAHGYADFACVNVGTGIGAGLVLGGDVYQGSRGGAGELAYFPFGRDQIVRPSRLPTFEQAVAPSVLLGRWSRSVESTSPDDLLRAAAGGDTDARRLVDEEVRLVAAGIGALASVTDPELVVLTGGFGSNPVMARALSEALADTALPVAVRSSALPGRGGVLGALLLAVGTAILDRMPTEAERSTPEGTS